jgi:hypothetical protein
MESESPLTPTCVGGQGGVLDSRSEVMELFQPHISKDYGTPVALPSFSAEMVRCGLGHVLEHDKCYSDAKSCSFACVFYPRALPRRG